MASEQPTISFDQIIQQSRDRKKAEKLASSIFGKGRRDSAPQLGPRSKSSASPSLASRISKPNHRSASSSSLNRTRVEAAFNRANRAQHNSKPDLTTSTKPSSTQYGKGFSIKGAAGPYVVVGSNFAPGTTSADIRSATEPIAGDMLSCSIITSNPTVIAEMVFSEKAAAEMIIGTLNNQKADGRILHLYLKSGPPTRLEDIPPVKAFANSSSQGQNPNDRPDLFPNRSSNKAPKRTESGMAEPEYQDGRYGFDTKADGDMDVDYQGQSNDHRRDQRDEGYAAGSDRRGYRQDYARGDNPRPGGYSSRGDRARPNRRPQYSERLYSDRLYSHSRDSGYDH